MRNKPGVMIYFDMRRPLSILDDKDKGILFDTILEYGETHEVNPRIHESPLLSVIWGLIQTRLDLDEERYWQVVVKRKYAAYVRWSKQKQETTMDFPEWMMKKGFEPDFDSEEVDLSRVLSTYHDILCK